MSELDHLRKKPPDGGLPLDIKDRKLRDQCQCQECGVTFYIGPDETSQQSSERRATLRRSIKAAKTKMRRLAEKGSAREQARLRADRANKESKRQAETDEARNCICKSKLCVRIFIVRQRPMKLRKHACKMIESTRNQNVKRSQRVCALYVCKSKLCAGCGLMVATVLKEINGKPAFIGDVAKAVDDDQSFCEDQG